MLRINKLIHRPAELLPAIQEKVTGSASSAREKLKLLGFYEQIARFDMDSAIGLTIGPLGILTKFATFKVGGVYCLIWVKHLTYQSYIEFQTLPLVHHLLHHLRHLFLLNHSQVLEEGVKAGGGHILNHHHHRHLKNSSVVNSIIKVI